MGTAPRADEVLTVEIMETSRETNGPHKTKEYSRVTRLVYRVRKNLSADVARKMGMWIFLVGLITFTPVMMKMSYYLKDTKEFDKDKYYPPTVHTMAFTISILLGLIITVFAHGKENLRKCIHMKSILMQAPVSVGYAISEALALFALGQCDAILYAVIHKMRLLETAIMTRFVLRRQISKLQWAICFTVTFAVLGFVMTHISTERADKKKADPMGAILLIINITLSVACSIYGDWIYKKLNLPLAVQIVQGRFTATLASLAISLIVLTMHGGWKHGFFGGPKGGWDITVVALMFFNIVRDWTTCAVLLYLDALWKALAGSTAVATTYVAELCIFKTKVQLGLLFLVFCIAIAVFVYAITKILEKERDEMAKENKDLRDKIQVMAMGPMNAWDEKPTKEIDHKHPNQQSTTSH